ncbi:hypothetical protein Celal_1118 [Cellulophaga algicola DSM 14237]|uniref:Uncharacterized protein n=1 Tax=Cellulophaga algicola (strain DSM 14237 / IC166 / ACAM 630) TaxID=688270 RepID=E6X5S1_CELAD|nr:hypothetical protein Celal_1118 [Cellulophaga algicola DSM 14237]
MSILTKYSNCNGTSVTLALAGVIQDFSDMFPNIEIKLIDGVK